jgi:hypothetical protein
MRSAYGAVLHPSTLAAARLAPAVEGNPFDRRVRATFAQGKCALEALYTRWPKLELAVAPHAIRWRSRPGLRAIISLPVVPGSNAREAA